jgi:hypothetical protein
MPIFGSPPIQAISGTVEKTYFRAPSTVWLSSNPVLGLDEIGWETDTGKIKVGDGETAWSNLSYEGIEGPQGAPGLPGINGVDGQDGAPGTPGAKGDTGSTGPQGLQGERGYQGDQGIQGIQGLPGVDGEDGNDGAPGLPGERGLQGLPGSDGVDGLPGEKGDKGDKGDTGSQGLQGIQGERGLQGDTGLQGIQGIKGDTGNTGAKGDTGDTGSQGLQGIQGIKGDTGLQGEQGLQGIQGIQGIQGEPGVDPFTRLILAADKPTGANVTPVTTGLVFDFEANSKYVIDIFAMVAPTASTTGCGFLIDTSVAVTYVATFVSHSIALTGTLSGSTSIGDAGVTAKGVSSAMPGTAIYPVLGGGILISTVNAGTATLFFRSETTAVTTLKAGTMVRIMKMA